MSGVAAGPNGASAGPSSGGSADSMAVEYQVKAAFLYNFTQFVTWPAATPGGSGDFTIGILGPDPFGDALDRAARGKSVGSRKLVVRRFRGLDDLEPCEVLFVSSSDPIPVRSILDKVKGTPMLTVGETSGFTRQGGVIGFYIEGSKVRFEINVDAASRAGLQISSRMLSLAKLIRDTVAERG